jgi:hypothetical protein
LVGDDTFGLEGYHIKSFQEIKAQDMSRDEINELVNMVKKEISDRKNSESS